MNDLATKVLAKTLACPGSSADQERRIALGSTEGESIMDLTTDRPDVTSTLGDTSLPTYLRPYAEELDRWHVEVLLARTRRAAGRSAPRYDDQPNASIA
jgi:hypothetical protein